MKKTVLLLLMLALTVGIHAESITREQAQQRAEQFLQSRKGARRLSPVKNRRRLSPRHGTPANATELYYVFDRGEDEGFIIASGDDRTEPVLGYCDQGHFDYEALPDAMKEWLEGYAEELQYLQQTPQAMAAAALPTHPAVATLMTTVWNQGDPFNLYCPDFFGHGRSVTGCVATAMAQVLYYNRAKSTNVTLADMPGWTGRKQDPDTGAKLTNEGVPAGAEIDWANMIDNYNDGKGSTKQKQAVAWLMHLCGAAVKMDYSNSGSGAYSSDVPTGCIQYFGYRSDCRAIWRSSYSAAEFDAIIYDQVAHRLPVYMSGGGHAYVCDGYDGNRYYHINWGWGGGGPDGYYLLAKLTPGEDGIGGNGGFGYSSGLGAVINMEPAEFGDKAVLFANATVKKLCVENWDKNGDGELSFDEAAAVKNIGTVFQNQRITTFNELSNFTGLTKIPDDAFSGCTSLTRLLLPENIKEVGARAFSGCRVLTSVELPESVAALGEEAFMGCRAMKAFGINEKITDIEARTFKGCAALASITLHAGVQSLGDEAFAECTKLLNFTVESTTPQNIQLGQDVFSGMKLASATLNALQGTREFFENADQWKEFGNIHLARTIGDDKYIALTPGREVYLWNVGKKSYLSKGEYNDIQNVLSEEPMRFIIYEGEDEHQGLYYIYSPDVTSTNKYTGRKTNNAKLGENVKYTVVNANLNDNAYWAVKKVAEGVYTFQVPEGDSNYDANAYWGIQFDHENHYLEEGSSTMATYFDVPYEGHEADCQWMFVDYLETYGVVPAAEKLEELLAKAKAEKIDATREQKIYDDLNSTYDDLIRAQSSLRKKLGIITCSEETLMEICLENWDIDGDGEFSKAEAEMVTNIGDKFKGLSKVKDFSILKYFVNLTSLPSAAFMNCSAMETIELPASLTTIDKEAFSGCRKLKEIILPEYVVTINASAFESCASLRTVTMSNPEPENVAVDSRTFTGLTFSRLTLQVPVGTKERYEVMNVWKRFGTIVEVRTRTYPKYSPIQLNTDGYIYNIGTRMYLCGGEAYGTQAVVGSKPYVYQFRRQNSMGEGVYYLYSDDTPNTNHIFFRTSTDGKVGKGIKACFIDGPTSRLTDKSAWWQLTAVEGLENVYTFSTPAIVKADFVEGEVLGIQNDHTTGAADDITWGTYWDIPYEGNERNCQWAFIALSDVKAAERLDEDVADLKRLIKLANAKSIDTQAEQAVYDDITASAELVASTVRNLREKLHLISFDDKEAKRLCVDNWDADDDGELSYDEAAAVTDIASVFKGNSTMQSFDELQYFTGLTEIPAGAFRSSAFVSIYLPKNVKTIADGAFTSCKVKYIALLAEDAPVSASAPGLAKSATLFVPKTMLSAYETHEVWSAYAQTEYTGVPTVTPNPGERNYGYSNTKLTYTVTGAPINGEPVLSCEVESASPVGEYPIAIEAGTITTSNVQLVAGIYTVKPAPLTVTAKSYTREIGEVNPQFEYEIKGFRNKETAEVLIQLPVIECDATPDSPWGEYEIRVSGGQAQNYAFEYVNGTLTINPPVGVRDIAGGKVANGRIYDLSGREVVNGRTGKKKSIYIINGHRVVR